MDNVKARLSGASVMRKFGLLGYPLGHSFSRGFFQKKFEIEKLEKCSYENFPVNEGSKLKAFFAENTDLTGVNVTIPYKSAVLPLMTSLDEEARLIGAVNCIHRQNNEWRGYNTDAYGFEMSIQPFLENKYERALILGTGGGSLAVAHVLRKWSIPFHFVSRQPKFEKQIGYADLHEESMKHFQLIINTTPLGTSPDVEESPPIPYGGLSERHFLYDLIYNPAETMFLRKGKIKGAQTMNGLKMLELQAERSWEIWNSDL